MKKQTFRPNGTRFLHIANYTLTPQPIVSILLIFCQALNKRVAKNFRLYFSIDFCGNSELIYFASRLSIFIL